MVILCQSTHSAKVPTQKCACWVVLCWPFGAKEYLHHLVFAHVVVISMFWNCFLNAVWVITEPELEQCKTWKNKHSTNAKHCLLTNIGRIRQIMTIITQKCLLLSITQCNMSFFGTWCRLPWGLCPVTSKDQTMLIIPEVSSFLFIVYFVLIILAYFLLGYLCLKASVFVSFRGILNKLENNAIKHVASQFQVKMLETF